MTSTIVECCETDVIIKLARDISIRSYRSSDGPDLAKHGNNRNIWLNLRNGMPNPYTLEDAENWLALVNSPEMLAATGPVEPNTLNATTGGLKGADAGTGPRIPAHYVVSVNDRVIGNIGLRFLSDVEFRTAELGYWLSEEYWGQGIMSLVVPAFTRWAFQTFGVLHRLEARTYSWNFASGKLVEKAGFKREGIRAQAIVKEGRIGDVITYGCLRQYIEE